MVTFVISHGLEGSVAIAIPTIGRKSTSIQSTISAYLYFLQRRTLAEKGVVNQ